MDTDFTASTQSFDASSKTIASNRIVAAAARLRALQEYRTPREQVALDAERERVSTLLASGASAAFHF